MLNLRIESDRAIESHSQYAKVMRVEYLEDNTSPVCLTN